MNRRNFVVGLGTVATISGVASVTAASFADSVTAGSDFRVIVDENLTLELGEGVPEEEDLEDEDEWTDDEINFDEVEFDEDDNGQLIYIEDHTGEPENEDIEIQLAIANDPDIEGQDGYDELLAVRNDGITDQEVGIEYVYGDDVDTEGLDEEYAAEDDPSEGVVDPGDVATLFEFEVDDDPISPDPEGDVDEARFITVEGGDTEQIDLNIDLDGSGVADTLADEADVEDEIFSSDGGAGDDFQLLDAIRVGVQEEDED